MNRTLATSLTTTLFLVISISGIMMFFHFYSARVKDLHEILGLFFIAAVAFHIFYNFSSMKRYFTKKIFIVIAILTLLVSNIFILQSFNKGESPKSIIIKSLLKAPLLESYRILNIENAKEKLLLKDFQITDASSLEELAELNNISPFELVSILKRSKD